MYRKYLSFFGLACFLLVCSNAFAYETVDLKTADTYYSEQSYQLALTEYDKWLHEKASDRLSREVTFKWADCAVKAKDANHQEEAQKYLQDLVESKDHDRWWAESGVTLASLYIERDPYGKNVEIKKMLDDARDYWAGSSDVTLARERFIAVSFMLADFVTSRWGWYSADIKPIRLGKDSIGPPEQPGNWPLQVLFEEILKVAKSDEDKARAQYSLGMALTNNYSGDAKIKEKAVAQFQKIIKEFPKSEWVDDSYYQLGMSFENQSDFIKAEETYRKFLAAFTTGESQWVNDVQRRLEVLINPQITVSVGNTFVPDSQIQFAVNRRNVKAAQLTLYKMDMVKGFNLNGLSQDGSAGFNNYQDLLRVLVEKGQYESLPVEASWKVDFKDEGKHISYSENKGLAEWRKDDDAKEVDLKKGVLAAGAYLLMATTADGVRSYELILVSDLALVSKVNKNSALFFAMDAKTGKPVADTNIKFNYSYYNGQNTVWEENSGQTDADGLLKVILKNPEMKNYNQQHQIFAVASVEDKQAFLQNSYYNYNSNNKGDWWLYAFADRPAYRPGETISLKGILRRYDGAVFSTSADMPVKARIYDAQGNQVKEGNYSLNAYGSFDDSFILDTKAVLGEYRLDLYTADGNTHLASAVLFSLEEYKLPEFIVNIHPEAREDKTGSKGYRLGDNIKVEVDAQYYFGGSVANAQVEYLVYQSNYVHNYNPPRKYPWYYEDTNRYDNYYDNSRQLIKQEKITTDVEGKAHFTIDTPKESVSDVQYHIEVRVVDQSRREIISSSDIKVTKNTFFAFLQPKNNLYRPGDKAQITIKTMTANDEPVSIEGKVTVLRNQWREAVIKDEKVATPGGYNGQEMITKFVKTNGRGEAVFEFEPNDDGYYVVEFTGFDEGREVKAQTNVFVCAKTSKEIGYKYGGLQIITEKDTYQVGETMRAMIVADRPDTWVLLTSEADAIYDAQLLYLEGSVKLVEIPVTESFAPNVHLSALSGDHYQMKTNTLEVIVPPVKKFLNVTITSDKQTYSPQEEGQFEITVTDYDGKKVDAQLAVGITDAAVYYIHGEYAPDIQQYFYGDKRPLVIQTQASFYQRPYVRLVRTETNEIITDEESDRRKGGRQDQGYAVGQMASVDAVSEVSGLAGGKLSDLKKEKQNGNAAPASKSLAREREGADKDSSNFRASGLEERKIQEKADGGGSGPLAEAQVRTDFRSTVTWLPNLPATVDGKTVFSVKFPDSLTTWRTTVRAVNADTAIGNIIYEVKSKKELIVRLQAPRFFTERDMVTISAIVNNYSAEEQKVRVTLEAKGIEVKDAAYVDVTVPAGGEKRVDWKAQAVKAGNAQLTVKAQSSTIADAMTRSYPVIAHGIEKFLAQALVLKSDGTSEQSKEIVINIPKERIKESTQLAINLSPSMAANLLDALPYLADYPYGCVEQTMSRFLPAVIVRKAMRDLGLSPQEVDSYISDVLEPRGDPKGHPQRRIDLTYNKVDEMTKEGLKRIYDFQHSDGGWGWWKDGESDRFMSAYVLWGLGLAREAGMDVTSQTIARAAAYLQKSLVEEENNPDMLAWMLHALAQVQSQSAFEDKQRERLWQMRDKLNPYTRSLFALSEHRRGNEERSRTLAQNLINGIDEDKTNGTAHWGESGINYRWSDNGVEATAFVVKALSVIDPQSSYLDPAVKWLSLNRRGARWTNTRDTAIAILSLTDYLKATHELAPDYDYQVLVNGTSVREGHVNAQNALSFGRIIDIPSEQLKDGGNTIKVIVKGKGALYTAAYVKYFTLEEEIKAAGNEISVDRKYYKQSVKETLMKGYTDDWALLKDGDTLKSGDRVRVDVILEAKNNYEYLISEDYKPAGLEAVALNSGSATAIALDRSGRETKDIISVYQEFRDQKAAFFISKLNQGKYILRYELRAEVPGEFHAMPNQAHAMYVPEIRANSDEMRVNITD